MHDTLSLVQEVLKPVRDGLQEVGRHGNPKDSGVTTMQMTIFDFVSDGQIADISILNRIQSAFPGWEAIGYTKTYEWNWKDGKQEDYSAIIRRNDEYLWVDVWLYEDGRTQPGYVQRSDFEPYWFDLYEKKGKHWVWRSLDDRNRVFEVARQNR